MSYPRSFDLPKTVIKPGEVRTVAGVPNGQTGSGKMRPRRIVITGDDARHLIVCNIKLAERSQFRGDAEVPAEVFSENVFDNELKMDPPIHPDQFNIEIRNPSDEVAEFAGVVYGID